MLDYIITRARIDLTNVVRMHNYYGLGEVPDWQIKFRADSSALSSAPVTYETVHLSYCMDGDYSISAEGLAARWKKITKKGQRKEKIQEYKGLLVKCFREAGIEDGDEVVIMV